MILTFYYMYATFVQWWRLSALQRKLSGTLNAQNALLLCTSAQNISQVDTGAKVRQRSLENLLFQQEGRIACTIVPRQKISLGQWAAFPKDRKCFPIYYGSNSAARMKGSVAKMHLLLQARLENVVNSNLDVIKMEKYGEMIAWRAVEHFEVILRTDLERVTVLLNTFRSHIMGMNSDLPLVKIELVDVDGVPTKLKISRKLKIPGFSHNPTQFVIFVNNLRCLYARINENLNPKITIENGAISNECRAISEVKSNKKQVSKHMLEVNHRQTNTHTKKSSSKTKTQGKDAKKSEKIETSAEQLAEEIEKREETVKEHEKSPKKSYSDVTANSYTTKAQNSKKSLSNDKNLQRQNATRSMETSPSRRLVKPPNILVYADTTLAKENMKSVLRSVITSDRYTIYDMPTAPESTWHTYTSLVIVCGNVPQTMTPQLIAYLVEGGRMLCLCSDLLYSVLQPFSTAVEVRENELVRFTYGEWRRVKMMHHIFCYQASPARKQFSRDSSDQSMSGNASPVAPRTPSVVDVQHEGKTHSVQVQVLGVEETWQTPSLLLASVRGSLGKAVFSQVHLEVDPTQYQDDEAKYSALKDSNRARVEILRHILSHHLEVDCSRVRNEDEENVFGPGYFLGRHEMKQTIMANMSGETIAMPDFELQFCTQNAPPATAKRLPVMVHRCPSDFSTVEYFDALRTQRVGRLVIYSAVLASTHNVVGVKLADGLAVIARRQTSGRGRAGNQWLSPLGCAMFSLQLHIPVDSFLGRSLSVVQLLVMVAVVRALKRLSSLDALPIGIKWPNDLYAWGNVKLGGLLCTTVMDQSVAVVNFGCGINLDNRQPTICVNEVIRETGGGKVVSLESYFAETFNQVEALLDQAQEQGVDVLLKEYYEHWLHNDAKVRVLTAEGVTMSVRVQGVDQFGYLQVMDENGGMSSVQPDGNTFDMLQGLIAPRLSS